MIALAASLLTAAAAAAAEAPEPPAVSALRPDVVFAEHLYEGELAGPGGVFCDPASGEIYVADTRADLVGVFDGDGLPVFAFRDRGHLREPERVVVDRAGRIVVMDADRARLKVFSYRGAFLRAVEVAGSKGPARLTALALDRAGNFYVGDDAAGEVVVLDADLSPRFRFGSRGEEPGSFRSIAAIAADEEGVFVVDRVATPAVQVFDHAGNFLRGWGEHQMGAEHFSLPSGVALDAAGRVVVVDTLRHEVKLFERDGRFVGRFGGLGARAGNVTQPVDVSVGADGRICVAERVGRRVTVFTELEPGSPEGDPLGEKLRKRGAMTTQ